MATFGELLKADRERLRLSQDQLARLLDVSQQAISRWEEDRSLPRRSRLRKIQQVLGTQSAITQALQKPQQETGIVSDPTSKDKEMTSHDATALLAQATADIARAATEIARVIEKIAEVLDRIHPPKHH